MKAVCWGTLIVAICSIASSQAAPITQGEKQSCKDDYKKFCGSYGLESNALRDCMDRAGHSLSHNCVEALIDAGEVSRSEVERRKKSGR
jgi:hypothetical protein